MDRDFIIEIIYKDITPDNQTIFAKHIKDTFSGINKKDILALAYEIRDFMNEKYYNNNMKAVENNGTNKKTS